MSDTWLKHRITPEERATFEETGLLAIENALSPEQVAKLTEETDNVHRRYLDGGFDPSGALFHPNFITDSELFQELVDFAPVLPKVWGILGWNIYLYHAP
jgi:ectoine hydroxylase